VRPPIIDLPDSKRQKGFKWGPLEGMGEETGIKQAVNAKRDVIWGGKERGYIHEGTN